MTLGERLMKLRKEKHLSQEEVAEKLNVTRQTVSKWELDQSTPDFDKILPICELYGISTNELLTGNSETKTESNEIDLNLENEKKKKRTLGIVYGILIYVVSVAWIMISVAALDLNPVISSGIFLILCGVATCLIVYTQIMYKKTKTKKEEAQNKLYNLLEDIIAIFTVIIYLLISFITGAWHITWIIWLIYTLVMAIIKLILMLRGDQYEE